MGFFDKMLDAMKLSDEDDEYYDDDIYEEDETNAKRGASSSRRKNSVSDEPTSEEDKRPAAIHSSKITPMRSARRSGVSGMEVCVIKPTVFEDSKEVIDTILSGKPVIMNMEGLDLSLAQRIIDVVSGACLALDGTLQKVSSYIFIVTPASVDISGDLQGIMDSFDISGIQTGF